MREKEIEEIISPIVEGGLGYEIVRVLFMGGQSKPTLQIMIDNRNNKPIVVEDCVKVSKAISEVLDENIDSEYDLEVSSPGLDRPLTKIEHFARFAGFEAKIDTKMEVEGRKRFKGRIVSVEGNDISIETDGAVYKVAFDNVLKAKLVLTDGLLKAYQTETEIEDEN